MSNSMVKCLLIPLFVEIIISYRKSTLSEQTVIDKGKNFCKIQV